MTHKQPTMEEIVSLCKRRGFIFAGSEIYGGLAGTWDYGPLGVQLRYNIQQMWWKFFVSNREDVYLVSTALLMNKGVWEATGHASGFNDPMVEDLETKKRFRADHLLEDNNIDPKGWTSEQMDAKIKELKLKSPDGNPLGDVRQFNMMFKTQTGATSDESGTVYLRPETAQGMFVNFKNIIDTFHPKLPFGIAQIGKAFRNEIAPGNFIFRLRELEQMEMEYFVHPENWQPAFEEMLALQREFLIALGLPEEYIHFVEIPEVDRAFYSKRSVDTEFDFPIGQKELGGLAYRTDHDLQSHIKNSGVDLVYFDEERKEKVVPHCIEPTFGVERTVLAVLSSAYREVEDEKGEKRVYLKLNKEIAPYRVAVFPLVKNKENITEKAREVYKMLKKSIGNVAYDDNANIGKRYRRQDEIGTPFCITVDYTTLEDNTVTVRNRDTGEQERVAISEIENYIK
jgi:glycyl-tRNA synthetase